MAMRGDMCDSLRACRHVQRTPTPPVSEHAYTLSTPVCVETFCHMATHTRQAPYIFGRAIIFIFQRINQSNSLQLPLSGSRHTVFVTMISAGNIKIKKMLSTAKLNRSAAYSVSLSELRFLLVWVTLGYTVYHSMHTHVSIYALNTVIC